MRRPCAASAASLLLGLAACGGQNEHPPDQLLRDSLGLEPSDEVLRVELSAEDNRERPHPAVLSVREGAFVEFTTTDRRLHTVRFLVDSLPSAAADFLEITGQTSSPPLLELGARFVVTFEEAPEGRYVYVVEGNGEAASGAILVGEGGAR